MLELEFSNNARKFLKNSEKDLSLRLIEVIKKLAENPYPANCKRIEGRLEKVFRVRVGDYRILYVVIAENNKLLISDIDKRSKVYD